MEKRSENTLKKTSQCIRSAEFAGQFYASGKDELNEEIRQCFLSEFGPGELPSGKLNNGIAGAICPHAGFMFSGPCAAHAYKKIAESPKPDTFVIIGLSHEGMGSCISLQDWETPLGIAKNDIQLSKAISLKGIPSDEDAHSHEHSIEVQIPFLQFACKNPKIVPIIAGEGMPPEKIGSAVAAAAKELGRKIIIIASSDFTHYGPAYGYAPFGKDAREKMEKLDMGAVQKITALDSKGFISYVKKHDATICGRMPIASVIEAVKLMGSAKASLLKYYTSGDISAESGNSVGYASIVFEK